jgi:homospermidine synthase
LGTNIACGCSWIKPSNSFLGLGWISCIVKKFDSQSIPKFLMARDEEFDCVTKPRCHFHYELGTVFVTLQSLKSD